MKHMWMHVVVIGVLLAGIVVLVNGIETALGQMAGIAQVNMAFGAQPSTAVSGTVCSTCGSVEWLLPVAVIVVLVVAMLACYCKHNGATH